MIDIGATAEFIVDAFETLGGRPLPGGALDARRIPGCAGTYVAVSNAGELFILLEVDSETVVEERRLKSLRVLTGENFIIFDASAGETIQRRFAMVALSAGLNELVLSFAVVVSTLLATLPDEPTAGEVIEFLDNLVELVAPRRIAQISTVVGLWGELWLITAAKSPATFASAWHSNTGDRFDFSFDNCRVEVKTTSSQGRVHDFGLDQLIFGDAKPTWIASISVTADPSGQTVIDLLDDLRFVLPGPLAARVSRIALSTLSGDIEAAQDFAFAPVGAEPLLVYKSANIPRPITPTGAPITNVRFRADLGQIESDANSIVQLSELVQNELPT